MKVKDITNSLEEWAPLSYQESYDNCGLLVGSAEQEITRILITLDVTEAVMDEAISKKCNLIIAHHPLIFKGLKTLTPTHWVSRCVIKAVQHDIGIYAIHTNLDHVHTGVNQRICEKLGLHDTEILLPKSGILSKLITFIPSDNVEKVMKSVFDAGAGKIGDYDHCSFRISGTGTFRPGEDARPHIGQANQDETVEEKRVEVIFPSHLRSGIMASLKDAHPYEEVAHYLQPLDNEHQEVGSGMIGNLKEPATSEDFLSHLKSSMDLHIIRHTAAPGSPVSRVAVCGGSGSFLLKTAIARGADVLVSGDFKYHDFFEADNRIMIADIGHFESEVFTKDLIHDFLRKKFANIALLLSEVNTNPINYT